MPPVLCEHERFLQPLCDQLAATLYVERNPHAFSENEALDIIRQEFAKEGVELLPDRELSGFAENPLTYIPPYREDKPWDWSEPEEVRQSREAAQNELAHRQLHEQVRFFIDWARKEGRLP